MLFKFSLLLFSAVAFAATEITIPSDLSDGTWLVDLANPTPDFQFLGELSGNLTGDLLLEDTPEKRWSSGFQPPTDQEISCYKTWLPLHGFRHIRYWFKKKCDEGLVVATNKLWLVKVKDWAGYFCTDDRPYQCKTEQYNTMREVVEVNCGRRFGGQVHWPGMSVTFGKTFGRRVRCESGAD